MTKIMLQNANNFRGASEAEPGTCCSNHLGAWTKCCHRPYGIPEASNGASSMVWKSSLNLEKRSLLSGAQKQIAEYIPAQSVKSNGKKQTESSSYARISMQDTIQSAYLYIECIPYFRNDAEREINYENYDRLDRQKD
jgi:hypothetical protein